MNLRIREAQRKILKAFAAKSRNFALAGGTALELYYLHHRFSADLDFFSPKYSLAEIDELAWEFRKCNLGRIKLESELSTANRAKIRFYTMSIKNSDRPLKIDFVEDTFFTKPNIKRFGDVPVYSVQDIYLQKIVAITGIQVELNNIGRQVMQGRREARDIFDVYVLSRQTRPLHIFLKRLPEQIQRGMAHWYQTFSRQDLKIALLDLDIYDTKFNSREMIIYLENEIKRFVKEVLE
jgi:predicted nucleotidyltransferase component of viral defense system